MGTALTGLGQGKNCLRASLGEVESGGILGYSSGKPGMLSEARGEI